MASFSLNRDSSGRVMVNLGCGARIAPGWNNIDFGWLGRLGRMPRLLVVLKKLGLLSQERYDRCLIVGRNCIYWDLRRGIPFSDSVVDVVYHSHLLEHIDRNSAPAFLAECLRVLKPGGRIRIVVPDLEFLARRYLGILGMPASDEKRREYSKAVDDMFDQMIVRTPVDRIRRPVLVRWLEDWLVGDTEQNGTLHRWMYDSYSLAMLLEQVGFENSEIMTCNSSSIEKWVDYGLDADEFQMARKAHSLYIEARKKDV